MIPYFPWSSFAIGPLTIHVWGAFVALGIGLFLWIASREAKVRGLEPHLLWDMSVWVVISSFIGARISHVVLYAPEFYFERPEEIVKIWNGGLSSLGGIIFGVSAAIAFMLIKRIDIVSYGDVICRSLPIAWITGRTGCFLTHMHPGKISNFFLAVRYPDVSRHDLGLYEALVWMAIGLFFWMKQRNSTRGFYIILIALLYAPTRFILDFFRSTDTLVSDARYIGLTPAQFGMIVLFLGALFMWRRGRDSNPRCHF